MFWGLSAVLLKIIVFTTIVATPLTVLMAEDHILNQADRIYQLTNELRESHNLRLLTEEDKLEESSHLKTEDIITNESFDHEGLKDYLLAANYDYKLAGENLARGFYSAEAALEAWKKSPTHYANLIDPNYRDMGLSIQEGFYQGKPTVFIVHHFGTPNEPNIAQSLTAATLVSNENETISKYQTFKTESQSGILVKSIYYILITIFGIALLTHLILEFKRHHIHIYKDAGLFLLLILTLIFI